MAEGGERFERFDPLDTHNLGPRWKRWLSSFEIYADSKGLILNTANDNNRQRRRALLLHSAGPEVQDIFSTLPNTGDNKDYDGTVTALNLEFGSKKNTPGARKSFRKMEKTSSETVGQFYTRLARAVVDCEFAGEEKDKAIRDQILCQNSLGKYLNQKLLEEGEKLTLKKTLEIAKQCEEIEREMAKMSIASQPSETKSELNYVGKKKTFGAKKKYTPHPTSKSTSNPKQKYKPKSGQSSQKYTCYRCGKYGHFGRDPSCPARGQTCGKCGGRDHFPVCCTTRNPHKCHNVEYAEDEYEEEEPEAVPRSSQTKYGFGVTSDFEDETDKMMVNIGGVALKMIIDSGATTNIIDSQTWDWLKQKHIKVHNSNPHCEKKLKSYGREETLPLRGCFQCEVSAGDTVLKTVDFVVIKGRGPALLGKETAIKLGVLHIGVVHHVTEASIKDKYPQVFQGVGKLKDRKIKLHIKEDATPVAQPLRRTPFQLTDKVESKVKELLDMDIIEPVKSASGWVNPVVIVPKAKGDIRLCVDMRVANESIERVRHPIPTTDEILQTMNGSTVFSKLDLKMGYHQLELEDDSRDITTFTCSAGLYRYKRLSFGINSASEQYQHEIQRVLTGLQGAANISDDIIVHGRGDADHDQNLEAAMQRVADSGLTLNPEKCQFKMPKLEFMGMLLSEKGIGPTEARVEAVVNAREPSSASEVRSFLGLVNFSARFIPDLATISEPLRNLTKKDVPFKFGKPEKEAFEKLKLALAESNTLAYYDPEAPTQVITDAGPVGLGAVLVQKQGEEYVAVSYASRSLTDCERRYSQTEKEALGIVWGCEKFHQYVYGMDRFDLITDHRALEQIYSPKSKPCARIERWVLRLQPYRFKVIYRPGKDNIADALSRLTTESGDHKSKHEAEEYVKFVATNATPIALTIEEIETESEKDEELMELRRDLMQNPERCDQKYRHVSSELCVCGSLVLRGTRIVIPETLRPRVLEIAHEGHLGVVATKQRLRTKVWWPGIDSQAERFIRSCHGCQLVAKADPPEPIRSTELPPGAWQDLAVDLMGPLPSGHSILVVVDYYSRYYEVDIMMSTTTEKVIDSLEWMFSRHGYPNTITSDNGPQFISSAFRDYCRSIDVKHQKVTARWAQANGEVERQNRSILKRIQIAQAEKKDWRKALRTYLLAYRSTPHTTTGVSPGELLFGRKLRTKMPNLIQREYKENVLLRDRDAEKKGRTKAYADDRRGAKYSEIQQGDKVLVRQEKTDKLTTSFNPVPHTVVSKCGNSTVVESPTGQQYSRNSSYLRKYMTQDTPSVPQDTGMTPNILKDMSQSEPTGTLMDVPHAYQDTQNACAETVKPGSHASVSPAKPVLRRSMRESHTPKRLIEE